MPSVVDLAIDFVELARNHAGKWVAIDPKTQVLLAVGSSAAEVLTAANEKGVGEPLITRVANDYGAEVPCLVAVLA